MMLFNGCGKSPKSTAPNVDPAHIAKVKVNREGVVSLNDQPVTIEELKASLLEPIARFSRLLLQGEFGRKTLSSQRRAYLECDCWRKIARPVVLEP